MSVKFDSKKKVTQNLKFKPDPEIGNLCLGYLYKVSVEIAETPVVDDKGNPSKWEFAGRKVPRLLFEFRNVRKGEKDPERFYFHNEGVVTQTKQDGTPVDESVIQSIYTSMFDRIIHIHEAFQYAPNYKELALEVDIDEKADVDGRVTQMTKFFNDVAKAFNKGKNEKPIYRIEEKYVNLYMKLIPDYQRGTRLEFPTFIGEGFIEMFRPGVKPTIEIKPNETVELISKKASPSAIASGGTKVQDELPEEVRKYLDELK